MKKYLENNTSLEDIKEAIRGIQKREQKRAIYFYCYCNSNLSSHIDCSGIST